MVKTQLMPSVFPQFQNVILFLHITEAQPSFIKTNNEYGSGILIPFPGSEENSIIMEVRTSFALVSKTSDIFP